MEMYYLNHLNERLDLYGNLQKCVSGSFHSRSWTAKTTSRTYGTRISGFKKSAVSYKLKFHVRGTMAQRYQVLDNITEMFEKDIIAMQPGKLYFGSQYIECYALASETETTDYVTRTQLTVEFYCPYPFWLSEKSKSYSKQTTSTADGLDFPHDYAYDYAGDVAGIERWLVGHYGFSSFKLTIYGPCANPRVAINGNIYQVYVTLQSAETLVIDSKNSTIVKRSGTTATNIFDLRNKSYNIFEPIESDVVDFVWSGDFAFEITLYAELSEPRWIENADTD